MDGRPLARVRARAVVVEARRARRIFPFAKLAYTGEPHSLHRYRSTAADELNAVRYASASPPGEKTI